MNVNINPFDSCHWSYSITPGNRKFVVLMFSGGIEKH